MAVVIQQAPAEWNFSHGKCNLCFQFTSDQFVVDAGVAYSYQLFISPAIIAGLTISINGIIFTFTDIPAATSTQIQREVGQPLIFGQRIVDALSQNFFGYTYAVADLSGFAVVTIVADNIGSQYNLVWDFMAAIAFAGTLGETLGVDAVVNENCAVDYEVYIDGALRFTGETQGRYFQDPVSLAFMTEIVVDATVPVENYVGWNAPVNGETPLFGTAITETLTRRQDILLRVRECCDGVVDNWANINTTHNFIYASCECDEPDNEPQDFRPTPLLSGDTKRLLNFFPDKQYNILCQGSTYRVSQVLEPGSYNVQVSINGTNVITAFTITQDNSVVIFEVVELAMQLGAALVDGGEVQFVISGAGGTDFLSEVATFIWKGAGCDLPYVLFKNCLGTYQTMYTSSLRNFGVQIESKQFLPCDDCDNRHGIVDIERQTRDIRTYYTRPMKATEANLALLNHFFSAKEHLLPTVGNGTDTWEIVAGEYSFWEQRTQRIQMVFQLYRRKKRRAL